MTRIKSVEKTDDFFPAPETRAPGSLPRNGLVIAHRGSYCAGRKEMSWAAFC